MKKTSFPLLAIVGLFLFLLAGCEKEPVVNRPIIHVFSASADSCEIGNVITIQWSVENASIVIVNKDTVPFSGTKEIVVDKNITVTCTAYPIGNMDIAPTQRQLKIVAKESTKALTITLTATPSEIFEGETTTIKWSSSEALSAQFNFSGAEGTSGFTTIGPMVTTTYTVTVYGLANKSVSASVTVVVHPVFTENQKLLALDPWKRIKWEEAYTLDGPWTNLELNAPCQQDDRYIFYLEPNKMVFDRGENLCDGETVRLTISKWSLFQFSIEDRNIVVLSRDTLVWWQKSIMILPDGISTVPIVVKETFIHPIN